MRHNKLIKFQTILALVVLLTLMTVGLAAASSLVLVSGPSPFAGCTIGGGPGAINYVNAEVEPWVAVNPTNPNNIIAVWQQDRWSDGGSHGLVTGVSHDGGATWSRFGSNLPLVAVRDLYLAPDGSLLRAATFGRGVWELQTAQAGVSLDKATATVSPSATTTFTATVSNFVADNKVNWTVSTGGGSINPAQTASGSATTYTAPATVGVYTITAASNEAPSATASATVNVYTPASVSVSVSPATANLLTGGTLTFTAAVANAPSGAVTWSASGGTITSGGVYTAPATTGTYTITATSIWPGTTPGTATVTVRSRDLNGDGTVDLRDLLSIHIQRQGIADTVGAQVIDIGAAVNHAAGLHLGLPNELHLPAGGLIAGKDTNAVVAVMRNHKEVKAAARIAADQANPVFIGPAELALIHLHAHICKVLVRSRPEVGLGAVHQHAKAAGIIVHQAFIGALPVPA